MISIEFSAAPGLSLTAKLFAVNSDEVVAIADGVTERAAVKGAYLADFSESPVGPHLLVAYETGVAIAAAYCFPDYALTTQRSGNYADVVAASMTELLRKISQNKTVTNPVTGTLTVYSEDDSTPLLVAPLKEDINELQPYRGRGAEVRGRFE